MKTRPSDAAQLQLFGRFWPRQQRTLRELLREPKHRHRAYEPIGRPPPPPDKV